MKRIIPFDEFVVNEASILGNLMTSVLKGQADPETINKILPDWWTKRKGFDGDLKYGNDDNKFGLDADATSTDQASTDQASTSQAEPGLVPDYVIGPSYSLPAGKDDFALYMQHQQGIAGAAGIVKALGGTGKMHPDTLKTKGGVKYANLVSNIPSDRPQHKTNIIKALDKGDQKTAAALFLNMWKEKWNSNAKKAQKAAEKMKNESAYKAIKKYSEKYNVPLDFALTVAMIESGLNPKAGNNKYKGLFAMDPNSSYDGVVTPMKDNWSNAYVNAENGIKLLKSHIVKFKKALGKDIAALDLSQWAKNLA